MARSYSRRSALRLLGGTALVPIAACGEGETANVSTAATSPPAAPVSTALTAAAASDLRPRYHIAAPAGGWVNDPQRPIRTADGWALWALYNPTYPSGGTSWRRWTSTDLVTWQDRGVAIPRNMTAFGDVWTGSTVRDTANTAGFGAGAIIALATMPADNAVGQNQSCALWYSHDEGATFAFHAIVLPNHPGNKPFRDPTIFWHAPTSRWVMTLSEEGKIGLYASPDLKNWIYASGFLSRLVGDVMECSHLFRMHCYEADGTTRGDKWVLLVGGNGSAQGFTIGTYYWVGDFGGTTFTPETTTGDWLDWGADFYAAVVWTDPNAADPLARAYAIAWMNNWTYADKLPATFGYRGQLSIVRHLTLRRVGGVTRLRSTPIEAQNSAFTRTVAGTNQVIAEGSDYVWPAGTGVVSGRIDLTLTRVGFDWPTGVWLSVRGGGGYFTQVGFQLRDDAVFLKRDTSGPGAPADATWQNNQKCQCDFSNGIAKISLFLDTGSIEVFLNDGAATMTSLIAAPSDATSVNLNAAGGSVHVSDVVIQT